MPGWIYQHRAVLKDDRRQLQISGGIIVKKKGSDESHEENSDTYELDLNSRTWSKL